MGLTIAITGAAGFIGRATVAAALHRGHQVRAITRAPTDIFPPEVDCICVDLADPSDDLAEALTDADVVIHAAASMSGDANLAARDTVTATENLLYTMGLTIPDARLVLVSSITVYDAHAREISESTPLDPRPAQRDTYAQAKLAQEATLKDTPFETWIARPGAVFGPGQVWNAHLGSKLGPVFLRLGDKGEIPVVPLASCAEALVLAAETPVPGEGKRAVNLVHSYLPTRAGFIAALGHHAPPRQIPAPWKLFAAIGMMLKPLPIALPGLLSPRTLRARFGEKYYSNARAESELNWLSRIPFENALHDALDGPV